MSPRPLRVAVVGLGDIAAKAYLPVLAATAGVELVPCSRDAARRVRSRPFPFRSLADQDRGAVQRADGQRRQHRCGRRI